MFNVGIVVVIVGPEGDGEGYRHEGGGVRGGNGGKRMSICITSILPDRALNRWFLVEYYGNGMFVRFLVGAAAISAQTRRYYRFFTGTILKPHRQNPYNQRIIRKQCLII